MPRIIIDASFLRAADRDGRQLCELVNKGYSLVVLDALLYELCSTADANRGVAALRKLGNVAEYTEVWEHVGVMLKSEIDGHHPYGRPYSGDLTARLGESLAAGIDRGIGLLRAVEETRRQRECDTLGAVFSSFPALEKWRCGLRSEIKGRPLRSPEVTTWCGKVVNSCEVIKALAEPSFGEGVNEEWVAWHVARSTLVLFCDYVRQGFTDIEAIQGRARERWVNRKHDLDYLICLHWASAIASQETSGEMNAYRKWLYGDEKPMIDFVTLRESTGERRSN